jgi:putative FmdB family regulatory protein
MGAESTRAKICFHARARTAGQFARTQEFPMPIYEYACQDCGREFEALVRSDTVPECPKCHSRHLDKQLSVFATSASTAEAAPAMAGPCGSCGHPDGPGSCAVH